MVLEPSLPGADVWAETEQATAMAAAASGQALKEEIERFMCKSWWKLKKICARSGKQQWGMANGMPVRAPQQQLPGAHRSPIAAKLAAADPVGGSTPPRHQAAAGTPYALCTGSEAAVPRFRQDRRPIHIHEGTP
jgi:hypothetical protein